MRIWLRMLVIGITALISEGADLLPVTNPSFESLTGTDLTHFDAGGQLKPGHFSFFGQPTSPSGFLSSDPLPGWLVSGHCGTAAPMVGPEGAALFKDLPSGRLAMFAANNGSAVQVLTNTFEAGFRYTLQAAIGRPNGGLPTGSWEVSLGTPEQSVVFDVGSFPVPVGEFRTLSLSHSVIPGDPLAGKMIVISLSGIGPTEIFFDQISLEKAPVVGPAAGIAAAVEVSWVSKANEWYRVERANHLTNPVWIPVTSPQRGTGERMRLFEVAGESASYYRVVPILAP